MGPGLSWASPHSEIKIMYNHVAIHTFIKTVIKGDALNNLAPPRALYFDVSNIRKSIKNIGFLSL